MLGLLLVGTSPLLAARSGELAARVTTAPPLPSAAHGYLRLTGDTSAALYVPSSYRPDRAMPLALLLHGASRRGDDMIARFRDQAEARGIILLAPDSLDYSWDIVVSNAAAGLTGIPPRYGGDVARIDVALAQIFSRYAVDPERVAIIGFSDGASYALSLGANNAGLFRHVVALAPGMMMPIRGKARSRIFIAHGRNDKVLPLGDTSRRFAPELRRAGFEVQLLLFDGGHEMPAPVIEQALAWYFREQQ
ncbi:phospholipase [Sphingomonas oleivorans]|uniref:Phospholipase n=1 Tax=Sphingomonas oleivorans TaxID=1735121 RepID=A0A2T5G256_9SPHN|nr:PHB depolymerase family esterase [Sphingomonas oleivorans]PTQ13222.1 phospholipase [Sphingomonas oleivorans]